MTTSETISTGAGSPAAGTVPTLAWRGVSQSFLVSGELRLVLDSIDLDVARGSIVSLIGPSGCGKTTLLKLAAGFETPTLGEVLSDGQPVTGFNVGIGYITQESNLYPWMTLRENVELPLGVLGVPAEERAARVSRMIEMVGLSGFEENYPHQLSGGMQKRASIIRTMIYEPDVVLMDEPFVGLDSPTRMTLFDDLLRLWAETPSTMLLVTHDLSEAITLSDEIVVMTRRPGTIKDRFPVEMDRRRDAFNITGQAGYVATYERIWASLRDEVLPGAGEARPDRQSPSAVEDRAGLAQRRRAVAERRTGSAAAAPARRARTTTVGLWQTALVIAFLALWQLASSRGWISDFLYSNPVEVVQRLVAVLAGEATNGNTVYDNLLFTMRVILIGYAIGAAAGLLLGFALARLALVGRILEPFFLAVQGVPKIALAPLFVLILGIGVESKVGVVVMEVFFIVFFSTLTGVIGVNEDHVRLARVMGASTPIIVRKVFVPSALPSIMNGLKLGVPFALTGAIIGEFMASTKGLGWYVHYAAQTLDASGLFVGILVLVVIIVLLGLIVSAIERRVLSWRPRRGRSMTPVE